MRAGRPTNSAGTRRSAPSPDDLWTLPDGRTLRVVRQPHPLGGLLLLFSDMTGELRLKAQYNALIQVQQATLDKLNDAVAVFGSDGRLRLHNEAFARFWNVTAAALDEAYDFDGVVELCVPRLHDQQFWRELKGRVTDPDPSARIADQRRDQIVRRPHHRLPVPAAAGRRDPGRLRRHHRHPQAGGRACATARRRWPRSSG